MLSTDASCFVKLNAVLIRLKNEWYLFTKLKARQRVRISSSLCAIKVTISEAD